MEFKKIQLTGFKSFVENDADVSLGSALGCTGVFSIKGVLDDRSTYALFINNACFSLCRFLCFSAIATRIDRSANSEVCLGAQATSEKSGYRL